MTQLLEIEKWKRFVEADVNQAVSDFCDRPLEEATAIANGLGAAFMAQVASKVGSDIASELLRNVSPEIRTRIIEALDTDKAAAIREVLSYPSGTAGALMAKEYLSVPANYTLAQATEYLRQLSQDKKGKISYIYVVDQHHRLEGVIQIRDLVFHPLNKSVMEILKSPVVQVETGMSQLDVARLLQRHKYLGLPVVDPSQKLVGVISADTAMQVFEEEASDDIAKIVGTSAKEIRTLSVRRIVGFRLPWLFVNIVSGLVCAFISGFFQKDIPTIVTLFLFVPVVLGLSESAGVQGATMVVRNIALGNISFKHLKSLFSGILVGMIIGSICGLAVGCAAYVWKTNAHIGLALAVSMTLNVIISALIGLALPLLFRRLKFDPAIASGPLVLALCDIQTLIIYFNIASVLLD